MSTSKIPIPEIVVESPQTQRRGPPVIMAPPPAPTERKKVSVTHGHSMANWMMKIKSEPKKPPSNRVIPLDELKQHNTREDCWMAIRGKVFDVTDYIDYHPGGVPYIMKGAGQDATKMFNQVHNYVNFENILVNRQVGLYISSEPGISGAPPGKGQGGSLCCCTTCQGADGNDENLPETSFEQDDTTIQYKVECNNPNMDANYWSMGITNKQNLMVKLVTRPPEIWLANLKLHEKLTNDQIKFVFENQFKKLILTLEKPTKSKVNSISSNSCSSSKTDFSQNLNDSFHNLHIAVICTNPRCSHKSSSCNNFKRFYVSSEWFPHLFYLYRKLLSAPKELSLTGNDDK